MKPSRSAVDVGPLQLLRIRRTSKTRRTRRATRKRKKSKTSSLVALVGVDLAADGARQVKLVREWMPTRGLEKEERKWIWLGFSKR